jgi:hypothetical protein
MLASILFEHDNTKEIEETVALFFNVDDTPKDFVKWSKNVLSYHLLTSPLGRPISPLMLGGTTCRAIVFQTAR